MKVFISYAHDDRARMLVIAEAVRAAGHQVDVDEGFLVGGDDFARRIEAMISGCDACIVLWSPSSTGGKPWVPAEANLALQKRKRVVSVKLAECSIPLPFSTYHMIDLTKSSDLSPLIQSLVPAGAPVSVPVALPRPRWPLRLAGAGVAVAVLSIGAWLAIPALQKPAPPPPEVPDAGPAAAVTPPPVASPAVPDAGQPPAAKPKPKPSPPPADPCASLARSYEAIKDHCQKPCTLDNYPLGGLDLEQCRACDQARTQLQRCQGGAR